MQIARAIAICAADPVTPPPFVADSQASPAMAPSTPAEGLESVQREAEVNYYPPSIDPLSRLGECLLQGLNQEVPLDTEHVLFATSVDVHMMRAG